jgi:ribosome-binding protein aMBF1 (putative translation factor)
VITGAQIRAARRLLGWKVTRLAREALQPVAIIGRAESIEFTVTMARLRAIRRALETAGVEFTDGDPPGLRLRRAT